jgi:hypothetical protein
MRISWGRASRNQGSYPPTAPAQYGYSAGKRIRPYLQSCNGAVCDGLLHPQKQTLLMQSTCHLRTATDMTLMATEQREWILMLPGPTLP